MKKISSISFQEWLESSYSSEENSRHLAHDMNDDEYPETFYLTGGDLKKAFLAGWAARGKADKEIFETYSKEVDELVGSDGYYNHGSGDDHIGGVRTAIDQLNERLFDEET